MSEKAFTAMELLAYGISQLAMRGYKATHIMVNRDFHIEIKLVHGWLFHESTREFGKYQLFGLKAEVVDINNGKKWAMIIDAEHPTDKDAIEIVFDPHGNYKEE